MNMCHLQGHLQPSVFGPPGTMPFLMAGKKIHDGTRHYEYHFLLHMNEVRTVNAREFGFPLESIIIYCPTTNINALHWVYQWSENCGCVAVAELPLPT